MNRIYDEFFYVPQHGKGKVREKVMITRVVLSVAVIIFCMSAMSFIAYAYFSHTVSSAASVIQSAIWKIQVTPQEDAVFTDGFYTLDNSQNPAERVYEFTVSKDASATATVGYTKIEVKTDIDNFVGTQTYYTEPIGEFLVDGVMTNDPDRAVKITVPANKKAIVKFTGEWGTCTQPPIDEKGDGIKPNFAADIPAEQPPETANVETQNDTEETLTDTAQ